MGALLHVLREDQERLNRSAHPDDIAAVVAESDQPAPDRFVSAAGQSSVIAELRRIGGEQRATIEAQRLQIETLARRVADLSEQVRTLKGENARPQAGCHFTTVYAGDAAIRVEFDYRAAEDGSNDPDSPRFGPSLPEEVEPLQVFVNGQWVDPQDVVDALGVDRLIEACQQHVQDERDAADAARAEAAAEAAREW